MHLIRNILYGLGTGLIIIGFLMIVYGEIRLNTPYEGCFGNECSSPEWIYSNSTVPSIIAYSGLAMMIVGGVCIVIGKKIRNNS